MKLNIRWRFALVSLLIGGLILTLAIYLEGRNNGWLNYAETSQININRQSNRVEGSFQAKHDYFGTVQLALAKVEIDDNQPVYFELWSQNERLVRNSYSGRDFSNTTSFPFGVPIDDRSSGRNYQFQIISTQADLGLLFPNPLVEAKLLYSYPGRLLVYHPEIIQQIVIYKLRSVLQAWWMGLLAWLTISWVAVVFAPQLKQLWNQPARIERFKLDLKRVDPFLIAIALGGVMVLSWLAGWIDVAKSVGGWIWLLIGLGVLKLWWQNSKFDVRQSIDWRLIRRWRWWIVIGGCLVLSLNQQYNLGGDDTRLFYLYPEQYLNNFALKIGSDTAISDLRSVLPPLSIAMYVWVLTILKQVLPFINLQTLFYSLNLVFGFYFFYRFARRLVPKIDVYGQAVLMIGGLFYVSSIFNVYGLYGPKLLSIFLLSIIPFSLELMAMALERRQFFWLVPVAVFWTIFSVLAVSLPWMLGTFLTLWPIAVYWLIKYRGRFIKYGLAWLALMLLLNINWLFYLPYSSVIDDSSLSAGRSISSENFRLENAAGIESVAKINNLIFPLLNSYHYQIQKSFNWANWPVYQNWYLLILPFNLLIWWLILASPIVNKSKSKVSYCLIGLSLLTSLYFYTVNLGELGITGFVWLNNHLPGFVMFRNMYDKFGLAMSINYSLMIAVAGYLMVDQFKNQAIKKGLVIGLLAICLVNAKPFLLNETERLPVWTTKATYSQMSGFNQDYLALVDYLKQQSNQSRVLWWPLNQGNLSVIGDKSVANNFYVGVSPLLVLADKNDYAGFLSLSVYGPELKRYLSDGDSQQFGQLMQKLNARWIVVDHSFSQDVQQSYLFSDDILKYQTPAMIEPLLGQKLADFGARYSLYQINDLYLSDKISLNQSGRHIMVNYQKIRGDRYLVELGQIDQPTQLEFLEAYSQNWQLIHDSSALPIENQRAVGYANSWQIGPELSHQTLTIQFKPAKYWWWVNGMVILTMIMAIGGGGWSWWRSRR